MEITIILVKREKLHYLEMKKQIGSEEVKYDRK